MLFRLSLITALALISLPSASASKSLDSLTYYYSIGDASAIARLHSQAGTAEERLLCSYRLYAITNAERWLENLPDESELHTARGLALLAAHWGFKAKSGPAWRMPTYGRRSEGILRRAQAIDADEPYAILVDGQSLYYKPAVFGGDAALARSRFERLRTVIRGREAPGIHPFEPEVWIWLCLRKQGNPIATQLRDQLLARNPPSLFREFLLDPP